MQRYPEKVRRKPPGPQGAFLMVFVRLPRTRGWSNRSVPSQAPSASRRPRGEVCQRAWSSPCCPCPVQYDVPRTSRSLVRPRLLTRFSALPWRGPSDHPLQPYGCIIDAQMPGKLRTCTAHLSTASGGSHGDKGNVERPIQVIRTDQENRIYRHCVGPFARPNGCRRSRTLVRRHTGTG